MITLDDLGIRPHRETLLRFRKQDSSYLLASKYKLGTQMHCGTLTSQWQRHPCGLTAQQRA